MPLPQYLDDLFRHITALEKLGVTEGTLR